ncbi:hypothetical protein CK203_029890 [Vitis vinifera]|uniref:Chorein N-terminal domain-containing protein n=1 Tax=Vitis vinifera TaxID=29760 RepID=A0A438IEE3_VITVI|nr:hypothetical protein CK203_029890 [Vitis vinifera]
MESIVALALEYTLKYWLKSFSRDQFKLQVVPYSSPIWVLFCVLISRILDALMCLIGGVCFLNVNWRRFAWWIDINGDALHSSLGLPPALNVTTAKVGKLEILLPYVSNVQIEPVVVQIDRLDLVLEENSDVDACRSSSSTQSSTSSGKGSGYGFADKVSLSCVQLNYAFQLCVVCLVEPEG